MGKCPALTVTYHPSPNECRDDDRRDRAAVCAHDLRLSRVRRYREPGRSLPAISGSDAMRKNYATRGISPSIGKYHKRGVPKGNRDKVD
jgi:hypothetical protein